MLRTQRMSMIAFLIMVAAVVLAGCSLVPGSGETRSLSDPTNLFHVKIPAAWQSSADSGYLSIYADKRLPGDGDEAEALSILVFTSAEASGAPVADVVEYLIDARAKSRGWKRVTQGDSAKVKLGGREAYSVDVTALDADGKEFESRYIFARTNGREVFVVAVAPRGDAVADFDDEISDLTREWYWHVAESDETTGAAGDVETQ